MIVSNLRAIFSACQFRVGTGEIERLRIGGVFAVESVVDRASWPRRLGRVAQASTRPYTELNSPLYLPG